MLLVFLGYSSLFIEDDLHFVTLVTEQSAVALENIELIENLRKKHLGEIALLEERQRFSRDLHDAVSQVLFSSSVIAEALPQLMIKKPEKVPGQLNQLVRLNRGAIAAMRGILRELRYDSLTEFRMKELLQELAHAAMAQTPIMITVEAQAEDALPPPVHITFYRIAQTALESIKYAKASEASLHFTYLPPQATLRIRDNGRGFIPKALEQEGIRTMQDCASEIGASLEVRSQPAQGTEILLEWVSEPLRKN